MLSSHVIDKTATIGSLDEINTAPYAILNFNLRSTNSEKQREAKYLVLSINGEKNLTRNKELFNSAI